MFSSEQYTLIDFGAGRKLERFGSVLLDRPCPAAADATPASKSWKADARFEISGTAGSGKSEITATSSGRGRWFPANSAVPQEWHIEHGSFRLELRLTEFGHLGVFPEQATNWDWIATQVGRAAKVVSSENRPPRVLNLFAYTGGSTLAAAAAGAAVVHVDAARSAVVWARQNAQHSGLQDAPIRWIVEDALKFVRREIKRGQQYEGIILDPPSYGHGPAGQAWKIDRDLPELLSACAELTRANRQFLLVSCHTPTIGPAELSAYLADCVFGHCGAGGYSGELLLNTPEGRKLPSGTVARWPA